jgi:alkylation response protein AidB-like acyl-CoA dehydrogenase
MTFDTDQSFRDAVASDRLDLPFPGHGRTAERWAALASLAERDLSLARLCEGHVDALAILNELGGTPTPGRWAVWAAEPPGTTLKATPKPVSNDSERSESLETMNWVLTGVKHYCSGARTCTHALVTAPIPGGKGLFITATDTTTPLPGSWPATGMAGSDSLDVRFDDTPATLLGAAGDYTNRPGFQHGGVGVAACWYGGARGVARELLRACRARDRGPHAIAHLGAVDLALTTAWAALTRAADEIDDDPEDHKGGGRARALRVRALVEQAATEVMERVGRALGAGPLCHDEAHGRRVADLTVYLRQHHAEADLAALGTLVAEQGDVW